MFNRNNSYLLSTGNKIRDPRISSALSTLEVFDQMGIRQESHSESDSRNWMSAIINEPRKASSKAEKKENEMLKAFFESGSSSVTSFSEPSQGSIPSRSHK